MRFSLEPTDMTANALVDLSVEAASALSQNKAIVALESTIITHGMPYPRNLETALMLEETVRAGGATPSPRRRTSGSDFPAWPGPDPL
jgi:pseudouridine-5'-phosphate glycosidase